MNSIVSSSGIRIPTDAVTISVNGQSIDPHDTYAKDAKHTNYILLTARKILSRDEEDELLNKLSVTILEDLGNDTFLCYYPLNDLDPIRRKEYIQQVDVYRNKFKIPEALEITAMELSTQTSVHDLTSSEVNCCTVDILTHGTVKDNEFEDLKDFIVKTSGVNIDDMDIAPGQFRVTVPADRLVEIAKDDRIRIIEEVLQPKLMSSDTVDSRSIVYGGEDITKFPYTGKGQIITVTDTGFDKGNADDCHPAFTKKIALLISLGRKTRNISEQMRTNDPHGHGTHVSGIIIGENFDTDRGYIGGIAPDAKLIVQSCYVKSTEEFKLPTTVQEIFAEPYEYGSRIFSNSWGVGLVKGQQPEYAKSAIDIDDFILANPDTFVCFSAGNDNLLAIGQPTIGLQAGAKNVLTVGATGNQTAPDEMYANSSMGPTKQKRMKPDVVAPGVGIFAALSQGIPKVYQGEAAKSANTNARWRSMSGTSQATPLVAGCAAILREALQDRGHSSPPGALLKALLINGADKLRGISEHAQGHGRVNLHNSLAILESPVTIVKDTLAPLSVIGGSFIGPALVQDEKFVFSLAAEVNNTAHTHFKITMVYNDIGNKEIQNNLNLLLTDMDSEETIPGNERSLTDPDVQNNVEQIILNYVPRGGVRVTVQAQKILAQNEQDFVVAWSVFIPLEKRTC